MHEVHGYERENTEEQKLRVEEENEQVEDEDVVENEEENGGEGKIRSEGMEEAYTIEVEVGRRWIGELCALASASR